MKKIYILSIMALASIGNTIAFAQDLVPDRRLPDGSTVSKVQLVRNLPDNNWPVLLASIIQIVLAVVGSLALIAFTYGGIVMITGQGNEEQIKKGKEILLWSIVALIVIAASYALVLGISQLRFT
jgi:hypothetical protein